MVAGWGYLREVNEASQPVYFDSLTLTRPQDRALVSQEQHYYPFGLALSGVAVGTAAQLQASKDQYNGGSELQDELLGSEQGIYSTFYRNYDPSTGRFQGVDPLAGKYADESPYSFAFNDPLNFNDPNGDDPIIMNGRLMNQRSVITGQETWGGSDLDYASYQMGGPGISTGYGGNNYLGSYREYDPKNGTYDPIQVNGKWVNPMYYTTVKVYGNQSRVEVYVWNKESSKDVGHVAIRVDDLIYGYYPTDINGDGAYTIRDLANSPGEMHINTMKEFREIYQGNTVKAFSLKVTNFQVQLLKYQLGKFAQDPGKYSLFGSNCSSVAYRCLRDGGINIIAYPGKAGDSGDLDKYIYWSPGRISNVLTEYNSNIISTIRTFVVPSPTPVR